MILEYVFDDCFYTFKEANRHTKPFYFYLPHEVRPSKSNCGEISVLRVSKLLSAEAKPIFYEKLYVNLPMSYGCGEYDPAEYVPTRLENQAQTVVYYEGDAPGWDSTDHYKWVILPRFTSLQHLRLRTYYEIERHVPQEDMDPEEDFIARLRDDAVLNSLAEKANFWRGRDVFRDDVDIDSEVRLSGQMMLLYPEDVPVSSQHTYMVYS